VLELLAETPDITVEELRAALATRGHAFTYGTLQRFFARRRVDKHGIGTPLWSRPLGEDDDRATVLTGGRAFSSSNWLGLRYPSAECRRRSLYFAMKRGRCSATSSWVSKAIG